MTAALGFAAGALAAAALATLLPQDLLRRSRAWAVSARRARDGEPGRWRGGVGTAAFRLLAAAGRRLRPGARTPRDLAGKVAAAGLGAATTGPAARVGPREVMAAKVAGAALGGGAGMLVGMGGPGRLGILAALAGPLAGFMGPDWWLARRARERFRRIRRELPALLDLLGVTVEAGASLPAALAAVGARAGGPLAAEWRVVGRELALGAPLAAALAGMTARVPMPEITALAGALERAARHGSPLTETLAAQARDARLARRRQIQEEAARAGPKIQLVVALLLVPSVLLMIAAALLSALVDGGGGLVIA